MDKVSENQNNGTSNSIGLRGLPGLNRISDEERQMFLLANEDKLKKFEHLPRLYDQAAEILYNNQQFKNTFGEEKFNSLNGGEEAYNYRNELLKNKIVDEEWNRRFNPFNEEGLRNNDFGLGAEWERFNGLSTDAKLKVLESDYKAPNEVEESGIYDYFNVSNGSLLGDILSIGKEIYDTKEKENNSKILEDIYNEEAEKSTEKLAPEVSNAYFNPEITGKNDEETKQLFIRAITPGSYIDERGLPNRGIAEYAAQYGDGKGDLHDMSNFTIDEMRQVLAKKAVYDKYLSPDMAATALNNDAKRYLKDQQGTLRTLGLFFNDVKISTLSYLADKVNGIYNLGLLAADKMGDKPTVWVDNMGNVVHPDEQNFVKAQDGSYGYYDEEHNFRPVHQTQIARTTLRNMGRDTDGKKLDSCLDPTYWTKAEQFGTMDEEEQAQYEKLGASPYKVQYGPGEDSNIWYEAFKMMSFGIADTASMFIPFGVGVIGKSLSTAGKIGNIGRGIGKAMNTAGKYLSYETKVGQVAQGSAGALGIAYAYQRGSFQETLAQNLANAEEKALEASKSDVLSLYNEDKDYKGRVDKLIDSKATSLKADYLAYAQQNGGELPSDELIRERAQEEVFNDLVQTRFDERKNSEEYAALEDEAIKEAGDAAMNSFLPEAIKYGLVNNLGHRKFLYRNPAGLARKVSSSLKGLTEKEINGSKRLAVEGSKFATYGQKAKEFGKVLGSQIWGGTWTNGTDDMMVDAAERISADSFDRYMNQYASGEALSDTYDFIDGMYSYWNGLMNSLGQGTTWNAAMVGGLGSVVSATPNMANILHLATKEGREAYKNNFHKRVVKEDGVIKKDEYGNPVTEDVKFWNNGLERINYFIQNGVLNTYYGKKQSEKELQNHADYINSILDQYKDFDGIRDLITSDIAQQNAYNVRDQKTSDFMKAIESMVALDHLKNTSKDPEAMSSVVQEAKQLIDRAAHLTDKNYENKFSEEELKNLLGQYYSHNNIEQSEENNQKALEAIEKNAQKLQEASKAFDKAEKNIQKLEMNMDRPFNFIVRKALKLRQAMTGHWKERLETMRSELEDNSDLNGELSEENLLSVVGGKDNAQSLLKVYQRQYRELQDEYDEGQDKVKELEEKYKEEKKNYKKAKGSEEKYKARNNMREAEARLENSKEQLKYMKDLLSMTKEKETKVNRAIANHKDGDKIKVLTSDEIFALDPVSRARMMDKENRYLYNAEQRKEIEALEQKILNSDVTDGLEKIQDISVLSQKIAANENAFSRIAKNPLAAESQFEEQRNIEAQAAYDLFFQKRAQETAEVINSGIDDSINQKEKMVFDILKNKNPRVIQIIDKDGLLPQHQKQVDEAQEWANTVADIDAVIDDTKRDEKWQKLTKETVRNIVDDARSKEEILSELEKVIDDVKHPQAAKEIDDILKALEENGYQRDATIIENRKKRKEREAEQKKRDEEAKRKLDEEVNKAAAQSQQQQAQQQTQQQVKAKSAEEKIEKQGEEKKNESTTINLAKDYLAHKITATDYLNSLGISTEGKSLEEKVDMANAEAKKAAEAKNKGVEEKKQGEENLNKNKFDEKKVETEQKKLKSAAEEYYKNEIGQNGWVSTVVKKETHNGMPIIHIATYNSAQDTEFTREYRLREDGKIETASDWTIQFGKEPLNWKELKDEQHPVHSFFASISANKSNEEHAETPQTAETPKAQTPKITSINDLLKDEVEEVSIDAGEILVGNANNSKKETLMVVKQKANGTPAIAFTIGGKAATIRVLSTDYSTTKEAEEVKKSDGIEKDSPFNVKSIEKDGDKWYFHGNFEGQKEGSPEVILPASSQFDMQNTIKNYKDAAAIKLAAKGIDVKDSNLVFEDNVIKGHSDTIEEQAAEEGLPIVTFKSRDDSDALNNSSDSDSAKPKHFSGNALEEYEREALRGNKEKNIPGKAIKHRHGKPGDSLEMFFNWLDATGIKLQNIIDEELHKIVKENPDIPVKFMVARRDRDILDGIHWKNHLLLVIDYTDEVAKVHNKKNGEPITVNGKKYLLIGTLGYGDYADPKNAERFEHFKTLMENTRPPGLALRGMSDYFKEHPEESFYINPDISTKIVPLSLIPGYLVRQMKPEDTPSFRDIESLLQDEERNPEIDSVDSLEKLGWIIQENNKVFIPINVNENDVMQVTDWLDNAGRVFVMIPAANGKMLPSYVKPVGFAEINNGQLKDIITSLLTTIGTKESSREAKLSAIKKLCQIFYLNKEDKNILIDKERNIISVVYKDSAIEGGVFNMNADDYSVDKFIAAVAKLNPLINITASVLKNRTKLEIYSEAGALKTDAAKLGTVGAGYSVFPLRKDGTIIEDETIDSSTFKRGSEGSKKDKNDKLILYKHENYREENGEYYLDSSNKKVEDPAVKEALEYNLIINSGFSVTKTLKGKDYYIINEDPNHPLVVARDSGTNEISKLSEENSKKFIENLKKEQENEARNNNASDALGNYIESIEDVDLGLGQENQNTGELIVGSLEDVVLFPPIDLGPVTPMEEHLETKDENPVTPPKTEEKPIEEKLPTEVHNQDELKEMSIEELEALNNKKGSQNLVSLLNDPNRTADLFALLFEVFPDIPETAEIDELVNFVRKKGVPVDSIDTSEEGLKAWEHTVRCKKSQV